MVDCRNKTNKSTLLKNYVEQTLSYFNDFHRRIKEVNILFLSNNFNFKVSINLSMLMKLNVTFVTFFLSYFVT